MSGFAGGVAGRAPGYRDARHMHARALHRDPLGSQLIGLRRTNALRHGSPWDRPVIFLGEAVHFGGGGVPDDDQDRVVGCVVPAIEGERVLRRQPVDLSLPADHRDPVRVAQIGHRAAPFVELGGRAVAGALAPFLLNHTPLGRDLVVGQAKIGHPVGFHPHHQLELVARDALDIGGVVLAREGVVGTAVRGDDLRELAGRDGRRSLEHQVFDEVGDAGFARRLVGRADLVPDHLDNDRGARILDHDDLKPVVQGEGLGIENRRMEGTSDDRGRQQGAADRARQRRAGPPAGDQLNRPFRKPLSRRSIVGVLPAEGGLPSA